MSPKEKKYIALGLLAWAAYRYWEGQQGGTSTTSSFMNTPFQSTGGTPDWVRQLSDNAAQALQNGGDTDINNNLLSIPSGNGQLPPPGGFFNPTGGLLGACSGAPMTNPAATSGVSMQPKVMDPVDAFTSGITLSLGS